MNRHTWILNVLEDLKAYAQNENLQHLLPNIEAAQQAAEAEIRTPTNVIQASQLFQK